MEKISLIICTRNRLNDLLNFFDSVKIQTVQPDEIIIVDSSDKKLTEHPQFIEKFNNNFLDKNISLIYQHTNPGLPYQRNIGISLAKKSDLITFFDDDVILEENYIEEIKKTFEKNPKKYGGGMGAITNVNYKKISLYRIFRKIFLLQVDHFSGYYTLSGLPTHPYRANKFIETKVLGGCGMTYTAAVLAKHKLDENLGRYAWMEDADLSKRVSDECPLFYNPKARLAHLKSPVNRDSIAKNHAEYIINYKYLFFKNFYTKHRWKIIFYYWSVLGLFIEAVLYSLMYQHTQYLKGYFKGLKNILHITSPDL